MNSFRSYAFTLNTIIHFTDVTRLNNFLVFTLSFYYFFLFNVVLNSLHIKNKLTISCTKQTVSNAVQNKQSAMLYKSNSQQCCTNQTVSNAVQIKQSAMLYKSNSQQCCTNQTVSNAVQNHFHSEIFI